MGEADDQTGKRELLRCFVVGVNRRYEHGLDAMDGRFVDPRGDHANAAADE